MKKITTHVLLIIPLAMLSISQVYAQDTSLQKSKWQFFVQPYLMLPNMNGTIGLGNLPDTKVDADPGDIFSHLQFGAMLYLEAHNNNWAITSDVLYNNLEQDVKTGAVIKSGSADAKQFAWELAGLRRINYWFEAGAGLRLNSLTAGLNIDLITDQNRNVSTTKTWVDPIIITRFKTPSKGKFSGQFRGDFGGFGVGSKFCWQLQLDAIYRCSKLFDLSLGYRFIGVDYKKGSNADRFLYNVDTFGPVVKLGFHF